MSAIDFLFEIGCEELPAKHLISLRDQMAVLFESELTKAQLTFSNIKMFATPRRLAIFISQLATQQPDQHIEKRGPAKAAAFDADGNPTKAVQGFAKSCGIEVTALETRQTEKGDWLYFSKQETGKKTQELLPAMIQFVLDKLPMPKRMRWGDGSVGFLRPIRWLCAVLGSNALIFDCYGLTSSNQSLGHRFHQPQAIVIDSAAAYQTIMQKNHVIVDVEERKQLITEKANELVKSINGHVAIDPELLIEVSGLVEWPVPLLANFDQRFLKVPQEALISAMQDHQKFFPVLDADKKILPHFIAVSNIESCNPQHVVQGNERVMRARLSDAEFFFQTDSKTTLKSRHEKLKNVVFQAKLGTVFEKSERIALLSRDLALKSNIDPDLAEQAAQLCKVDLLTDMVGEFPELQGIMGYYYAIHDNEPESLAIAIKEHYMPRFAGDTCPATKLGMIVALADRIDSLVGIFGINMMPTGDKDPYALRRAANGILRICIESQLSFDLRDMLTKAVLDFKIDLPNQNVVEDCLNFIFDRLKSYSNDLGFDALIYSAVHANLPTVPYDFLQRMLAVKTFRQDPAAQALVAANKRVSNILSKTKMTNHTNINTDLLADQSEQILVERLVAKQQQLQPLLQQQAYTELLQSLAELREPIDQFFDNVMVMADDEKLRANRLAILTALRELFTSVADIALLAGGKD